MKDILACFKYIQYIGFLKIRVKGLEVGKK